MKQILLTGGLLAGDFVTQAGMLLAPRESQIGPVLLIIGGLGLLLSLVRFANDLLTVLTLHRETFTV